MKKDLLILSVLISGSGTTLQNLIDCIAQKKLAARIGCVIASRDGIAGIDRARNAGLDCHVIARQAFADVSAFSRACFAACDSASCDLVCLAGWLSLLEIPAAYHHRVLNIHPALLPAFGGKGMYGSRVHQAVLDAGCRVSGCTVHFASNEYDAGPIILQRVCPVLEDDSADTLAHRVFEEEKIAYPQAIELYRQGKIQVVGNRVRFE